MTPRWCRHKAQSQHWILAPALPAPGSVTFSKFLIFSNFSNLSTSLSLLQCRWCFATSQICLSADSWGFLQCLHHSITSQGTWAQSKHHPAPLHIPEFFTALQGFPFWVEQGALSRGHSFKPPASRSRHIWKSCALIFYEAWLLMLCKMLGDPW